MCQPYLALFLIVTFFGLIMFKSASCHTGSRHQNHKPILPKHTVDIVAGYIGDNLLSSPVFGSHAHFKENHVHDLYFRVANRFVLAAGIDDPRLAEIVAKAGEEVGPVDSHLHFYTNAYTFAKFMHYAGVLSHDNGDFLALKMVSEIERVACKEGVVDTETTMNAVVYGFFNALVPYGLINDHDIETVCHLFALEIKRLAAVPGDQPTKEYSR